MPSLLVSDGVLLHANWRKLCRERTFCCKSYRLSRWTIGGNCLSCFLVKALITVIATKSSCNRGWISARRSYAVDRQKKMSLETRHDA